MTEWVAIIGIGFLLAGGLWVMIEAVSGKFGAGAGFLVILGIVVVLLAWFGRKQKGQRGD